MNMSKYEIDMLNIIRDTVDEYLQSSSFRNSQTSSIVKAINRILPKITTNKIFGVSINNSSDKPFIMSIYPDIHELDAKSESLINILNDPKLKADVYAKKWCEIKKWIIEIDIRILLKGCNLCVTSGSEFVGLLCHELGHVMIEDPIALIKTYRNNKSVKTKFDKMIGSKSKVVRKIMLPMFIHTLPFRVILNDNSIRTEIQADGYVPPEYRGSLLSYIENILLLTPESDGTIVSKESYENDQDMGVNFPQNIIDMMTTRSDVLKQTMSATCKYINSVYQKKLMSFVSMTIFGYDPTTKKTNIITERSMSNQLALECDSCHNEVESLLEATRVTDRDLTILEVECSEVKTTEDKIYLIHTIYDYIEAVQKDIEKKMKKVSDPKLKELLKTDSRLSRLNSCRDIIMNTDTSDVGDEYGVFVKYPKGYEG